MMGMAKVAVTGPPAGMAGITKHLMASQDVGRFAQYFEMGAVTVAGSDAYASVLPGMTPTVAAALGLAADQAVISDTSAINSILAGRRADGERIEGKHYASIRRLPVDEQTGERRLSYPIGSYIFSPAPDKSVSAAWALAGETER